MKNNSLILITMLLFSVACDQAESTEEENTTAASLLADVMTVEKQSSMSFEQVIADLEAGNARFMENHMYQRDNVKQLESLETGQHPKAVILSCIDSRVPVEEVFDQGVGDLFVIRVAGNIDNDHNLGSLGIRLSSLRC